MRYRVNPLISGSLVLSLLVGIHVNTAGQSTQCDCATPPGGSVTCEKGQVPICIIKNGKVISICKSPPESRKTVAQQNAWILSIILEKEVTEEDLRLKPEYQGFLRRGQLNTPNASVMFAVFKPPGESLPQRLRRREPGATRVVRDKPSNKEVASLDRSDRYYRRGEVLLSDGHYTEAEIEFRKALALQPTGADAYLGLGLSFYQRGRLSDAEAAYLRGLRLDPGRADLYAALGAIYYAQDKFSEAEATLKKALSLNQSAPDFYEALGTIFYAQLKFAEAETAFRRGVLLKPDSDVLYTKLGDALFAQQKFAEAEGSYAVAERLIGPTQTHRKP